MASGWSRDLLESLKPLIEKLVRDAIQQALKDLLPGSAGPEPCGGARTVLLEGPSEQTARRKGKGVAQQPDHSQGARLLSSRPSSRPSRLKRAKANQKSRVGKGPLPLKAEGETKARAQLAKARATPMPRVRLLETAAGPRSSGERRKPLMLFSSLRVGIGRPRFSTSRIWQRPSMLFLRGRS